MISKIIKASASADNLTGTLIILDITKIGSNNCFIIH